MHNTVSINDVCILYWSSTGHWLATCRYSILRQNLSTLSNELNVITKNKLCHLLVLLFVLYMTLYLTPKCQEYNVCFYYAERRESWIQRLTRPYLLMILYSTAMYCEPILLETAFKLLPQNFNYKSFVFGMSRISLLFIKSLESFENVIGFKLSCL